MLTQSGKHGTRNGRLTDVAGTREHDQRGTGHSMFCSGAMLTALREHVRDFHSPSCLPKAVSMAPGTVVLPTSLGPESTISGARVIRCSVRVPCSRLCVSMFATSTLHHAYPKR